MTALTQRLGNRLERWVLRRAKRAALPLRVSPRRIYIMPTGAGYAFGAVVFGLWLGAMNYSNSMGFALSFLLAGIGLVAMHLTHANLLGVELRRCRITPVHAGETARIALRLGHSGRRSRPAITVGVPRNVEAWGGSDDLPAEGSCEITLHLPTTKRGWQELPPLSLSTVYPLGLFRAWSWLAPDHRVLVYPTLAERAAQASAPRLAQGDDDGQSAGSDHFDSLRDYQRGDALHDIHWKRFPRQQAPVVKQFLDTADREVWFDFEQLTGDAESRLRRLARLVCDAEMAGLSWGLRLPQTTLQPAAGAQHHHACLRALALAQV